MPIQVESPDDAPDMIAGQVGEVITRVFDGGKAGREKGAAIGNGSAKLASALETGASEFDAITDILGTSSAAG